MLFLIQFIVFASAFLLFTLEFIVGKIFLSAFGGSYLIWGGCLVFFQLMLLIGYKYAQIISERCDLKKYRVVHCGLLLLPFLFFPGQTIPFEYQLSTLPLVVNVMYFLTITIGCAFFMLSTASTIWQSYLSISDLPGRNNPYVLFSVSNFGSFMALLAYPFVFELYFDLYQMQMFWFWGYLATVVIQGFVLFRMSFKETALSKDVKEMVSESGATVAAWIFYSAAGVVLFMAVTNILTLDITPMPLLWMVPLAIYLLSFYLNFKNKPFQLPVTYRFIAVVIGVDFVFFLFSRTCGFDAFVTICGFVILQFLLSMFVQYRLYELKPEKYKLGKFYFYLSLGGFLGGAFVTWVIPFISTTLIELPLGLLLIIIGLICEKRYTHNVRSVVALGLWLVILFIWPRYYNTDQIADFAAVIVSITAILFFVSRRAYLSIGIALVPVIVFGSTLEGIWDQRDYIMRYRNYYGIGRIHEEKGVRYFEHGSIIHGAEFLDEKKKGYPLTYYHLTSPVGEYLTDENLKTQNIGAVGLGVGVFSTYLWADQTLDYYELERDVHGIAKKYFSFLDNTSGEVNVIYGDARKKLCSGSKKYGLIIEDAFSGDSIPVHLLTKEALTCYKEHLDDDGVLLFHMSNKYIDSGLGLIRTALALDAHVGFQFDVQQSKYLYNSNWIFVTWSDEKYEYLIQEKNWSPVDVDWIKERSYVLTDSYSSLLPFIKWRAIGIKF